MRRLPHIYGPHPKRTSPEALEKLLALALAIGNDQQGFADLISKEEKTEEKTDGRRPKAKVLRPAQGAG